MSIQSAKDFVADALGRGKTADGQLWKQGLNWFLRQDRKRPLLKYIFLRYLCLSHV
ncbi:MAG TPA: hypothetical protein VL793_16965 [Patescibacteria group bacterium]|nr:hypothetical protein [Patescibacteria group bacterium]